jgi:hypothetical protein
LDAKPGKATVVDYMRSEARFHQLDRLDPRRASLLTTAAQHEVAERTALYEQLAVMKVPTWAEEAGVEEDGSL